MNRIKGKDWLFILLDIVSVNAAYFLALVFRFYMNFKLQLTVAEYPEWMLEFSPLYTAFCLLVFWRFRLYGGMWRYAGINDVNRILGATAVTAAFQLAGTLLLFPRRFPYSYYVVGAILQGVFVTVTRFSYLFWMVEKRKFRNWRKTGEHAMVIGAGEAAVRVIRSLEEREGIRPVCILDSKGRMTGRMVDGFPVYGGMEMLESAVSRHDVKHICIADPTLQSELKNMVDRFCRKNGIELEDLGYSIYLSANDDLDETRETVAEATAGRKVIPFSPPDISEKEIAEVVEALRSGWITTGPRTKRLQRRLTAFVETGRLDVDTDSDLTQWRHRTVCLGSATAAEELNLRILGIGEGDEVIVPAYTYTATASSVIHCGAAVKFVDIRKDGAPDTGMPEMDWDALENAITEKTKAVIAVDLGGIVADYDRIFEIVEKKKALFVPREPDGTRLGDLSARIQRGLGCIAVLADSAHSLGASRTVSRAGDGALNPPEKRYCGRIAHFTSFSFHAVKNFTTAEGGASMWCLPESVYETGVTNDEIYTMYQRLSLHGQSKDALVKAQAGAWEYDVVGPWYKCNMTDVLAAIGLKQLDRYKGLLERRAELIRRYDETCGELGLWHLCHHTEGMESSCHLYLVRIPDGDEETRNRVITEMARAGVSTNVHYKPLPMMTAYRELGWNIADFPNAYDYYRNVFTLPLHTLLSDEDAETVCGTLRKVITALRAEREAGEKAC